MTGFGIALDIGTSGFRAQAIDLSNNEIISTAITIRHPIPGANVIDHVNFAVVTGTEETHRLMIDSINRLLGKLDIDLDKVERMAVCGNPFQLSLFQKIEIRDLAYAGKNMLDRLGVVPPKRDGDIVRARDLGLDLPPETTVMIPPAVSHEIGADALAMLLMTGIMDQKEPCLVIDYGTNAEMALVVNGNVYSGSAAAGPALEGQQVEMGMLAAPGAISDVTAEADGWRCSVLDDGFMSQEGDTVDPTDGRTVSAGEMHGKATGITGTGLIAAIASGIGAGLIVPPKIKTPDHRLHLQDGVYITENDVSEAGKAIGAIRAGFLTLMREAGLWTGDVRTAFMSGASGLYVDAVKAQSIGLVPPESDHIIQLGNTSLAMAKELVLRPERFQELKSFAKDLRASHCMFATSDLFKHIYSIELSLWYYSMPMSAYSEMLAIYKLPPLPPPVAHVDVERRMSRDIPDLGRKGIAILRDIGVSLESDLTGCVQCGKCTEECPEDAITIVESDGMLRAIIRSELCSGTACRRCEQACPNQAINFNNMRANSSS
ncbi:MAG TPA: methylamine methyltransferase corrinoid protein reductive activase [Methanomassiliicoccales archaeon]|jgi:methylamine methyltransferase corrinoid protein reductive activase